MSEVIFLAQNQQGTKYFQKLFCNIGNSLYFCIAFETETESSFTRKGKMARRTEYEKLRKQIR